ncbi:uncharacterized protein LOC110844319 isoform X2 [Folsomia candida]|uniref:uncharacterized protein LOC110844319 isoform X2 n=1 Tax=Folsomia candida TaxID=158441 RepID=UPI0016050F2E|nr:uncharacterized protein LOC110844319 isoform X2 [Folsomia candida]
MSLKLSVQFSVFMTNETNHSNYLSRADFLSQVFGTCFIHGNNLTINVKENCALTTNIGKEEVVYETGSQNIVAISNLSSFVITSCQCAQFKNGSELVGIIFSPYDKHAVKCKDTDETEKSCLYPDRKKHVNWWDYSKAEIMRQLELVATEFRTISTYGIGTVAKSLEPPEFNHDWRDGLPIAQVPFSVAEINKDAGYHKLKIIVGAFSHESYTSEQFQAEVDNAVMAAKDAENSFPGSISGISIHFNVLTMQTEEHVRLVQRSMTSARGYTKTGGKVGVRLEECDLAFKELYNRSEESARLYCKPSDLSCTADRPLLLEPILEPLVKNAHFVICFTRPQRQMFSAKNLKLTMSEITEKLGHRLEEVKKALLKVNPKIELMVETGWPSKGTSSNGSPNSVKNMHEYWAYMIKWAVRQRLRIFMFEAFDEPWKSDLTLSGRNVSNGLCGSEDHYGLWRRKDNSIPAEYQMKGGSLLNFTVYDTNYTHSIIEPGFPEGCQLEENVDSPRGKVLIIAISITGIVFGLMIFGLGYMAFRLKLMKKNSHLQLSQKYLEIFLHGNESGGKENLIENDDYQIIALQFPYDKRKYELAKGSFKIDLSNPIGKGQSGTVYLGQIDGYPGPIAFKSSDSSNSILDIKNFLSEIKIMSYIGHHENIVCLIGAYTEKLERGIVNLALEYCVLGSLDKFLLGKGQYASHESTSIKEQCENLNYVTTACLGSQSSSLASSSDHDDEEQASRPITFDLMTMFKWSYQIANGMEYLASKKVVHADLACRNILLTSDMTIKITDFGLSRKLYSEITPALVFECDVPLPWRWMAPESLRKLVFSTESDVFSFGVTIWEIFTLGDVPFAGLTFCNQFVSDLEGGMRLEEAKYATDDLLDLLDECWAFHPNERPNFTRLKEDLSRLL